LQAAAGQHFVANRA